MKNSISPCIFCQIVDKEEPASLVYEDEDVISFLDLSPVNVGHLLVVPKLHVYSLADLDERISLRLFGTAMQLLRVFRDSEQDWEGMNLHLAEGEAASQEIPHVHLHLIPRKQGDAVQIHLPCSQLPSRKELDGVAARLRHGYRTLVNNDVGYAEENGMKKAVLMLSGGPDSSTLAYWLKHEGYELHTLTFNFGETEGAAERRCAKLIAEQVSKSHQFVDFSDPMAELYGKDEAVHILRKVAEPPMRVKGFGSGVAISMAASYALEMGVFDLFYAVHRDDAIYSDNCPEYFQLLSQAISMEVGRPFTIHTPFLNRTKAEVLQLAESLGVPLTDTWSCARGSQIHCGTCDPCRDRMQAFASIGINDQTTYQVEASSDIIGV